MERENTVCFIKAMGFLVCMTVLISVFVIIPSIELEKERRVAFMGPCVQAVGRARLDSILYLKGLDVKTGNHYYREVTQQVYNDYQEGKPFYLFWPHHTCTVQS